MNLQKLISTLAKQEQNIKNLLQLGLDKKEILIINDFTKLNEMVALEERCLLSIQLTEESRLKVMHDLFLEYNIDNNRYKLEILIQALKGRVNEKFLDKISKYEARIKKNINEITTINALNMMLIQQTRSINNETIQALVNSNSRSILDRKG